MNWEAKLEEARQRRAAILEARQAAEAAQTAAQAPKRNGRVRMVDMAEAEEKLRKEVGEKAERENKPIPVLVLDDAYQLRKPEGSDEASDTEPTDAADAAVLHDAIYPDDAPADLARDRKKPMFRTSRGEMSPNAAKGITMIAIAGVFSVILFQELVLRGEAPVQVAEADILEVAPDTRPAFEVRGLGVAPVSMTMAEAIRPVPSAEFPEALSQPLISGSTGPDLSLAKSEEPILLASLEVPNGLVLPTLEVAPEKLRNVLAASETKRIRVIVPGDVPNDTREAVVAQIADVPKAELDAIADVDYRVSATHVRYYHEQDRDAADTFAGGIGAELRDFTEAGTLRTVGYLEVYLKGSGVAEPEAAVEVDTPEVAAAATEFDQVPLSPSGDSISRVIDEILQN